MKIAIIGAGPIGSILGAYLAKAGNEVALVDILKDHLTAIRQKGLTISGVAEINARVAATYARIPELVAFKPEVIFVCVKVSVVNAILPELRSLVSSESTVRSSETGGSLPRTTNSKLRTTTLVSFQNGLDAEQPLADAFGKDNTLRVVINYAGNLIANGEVKMSFFNKPNYIGALSKVGEDKAKKIAEMMTRAGLDTKDVSASPAGGPDIQRYVWEKVILNAALSPLCAITGQTMKQAMDFAGTYHLVEEILKEGIAVAKALGYDYGPGFYEHCLGYLKKAGHHQTSMHIDITNKRPTEIDFINKKIVDYGLKSRIPTPYNDTIVSIIKALETINSGTKS